MRYRLASFILILSASSAIAQEAPSASYNAPYAPVRISENQPAYNYDAAAMRGPMVPPTAPVAAPQQTESAATQPDSARTSIMWENF